MAERATKKVKARKGASMAKKSRPDGSISAGIYDSVEKLVAGNQMSRAAAFRQIAKQTGRKEGTVAVNYYYAAKKRGAKLRKRGRPASAAPRTSGGSTRLESLLKSLEALIRAQTTELETLRQEKGRLAEIRKLIGRV